MYGLLSIYFFFSFSFHYLTLKQNKYSFQPYICICIQIQKLKSSNSFPFKKIQEWIKIFHSRPCSHEPNMMLQWVVSVWFFSTITKNYGNRNLHGKCFDIPRRQFSKKCACKYISRTISFQLKKKLIIKITEMTFAFPYLAGRGFMSLAPAF